MGISDTSTNHYYVNSGTYVVTLTAFGNVCTDTSSLSRIITVVSEITSVQYIKEADGGILINRDENGYYVKFDNYKKTGVVISISDLLGEKVNDDIKIKDVLNEKVYLALYFNGLLLLL